MSNEIEPVSFASRIARLREHWGLTQSGFAKRIKVSQGSVSKWESGAECPSGRALLKMEAEFGVGWFSLARSAKITAPHKSMKRGAHRGGPKQRGLQ